MKKLALSALAVTILMLGMVSNSLATDIVLQYSFDGTTFNPLNTCNASSACFFSGNVGSFFIQTQSGLTGFSTANQAQLDSTFSVGNTVAPPAGISTIYLREIATNFNDPASSPLNVNSQESVTSFTGGITITTTGGIVGGCSTTTPSLTGLGGVQGPGAVCANPGPPFGLITTTTFALDAGANVGGSTSTTASTVPEPASIMMFGSGLLGFAGMIRRKLNK